MSVGSNLRKFINWVIPLVLIVTYLYPVFVDPSSDLEDLSPIEVDKTRIEDRFELWMHSPPEEKDPPIKIAAWALCWATGMLFVLMGEPTEQTHVQLAKFSAVTMLVVWPMIWYVLPVEEDYRYPKFETHFYDVSTGEIVMGVIYAYLGWYVPPEKEKED